MNSDSIKKLFQQVKKGTLSPDEAAQQLRHMPFEDLGFANIDHHRSLRAGMAEVIFGPGKEPLQLAAIFARLAECGNNVLATRVTDEQFRAVKRRCRKAEFHPLAPTSWAMKCNTSMTSESPAFIACSRVKTC